VTKFLIISAASSNALLGEATPCGEATCWAADGDDAGGDSTQPSQLPAIKSYALPTYFHS
jgi:hypothetical protein